MKKIFLLLILSATVCSCNSFLTEEPQSSVYEQKAYDTPRTLEANVTALYSSLSTLFSASNFVWQLNSASLYTSHTGNRPGVEFTQLKNLTMYSTSSTNAGIYKAGYSIIGRCNSLLDVLPQSPVDAAYKAEIEGETRFLRAFTYFAMARLYGGLVLMEHAPEVLEDSFKPRATFSEVYALILKDLEYAETYMRTSARQDEVNHNAGRSHRMAATALKAMVYSQIACLMEYDKDNFYDVTRPGHVPDFTEFGIHNYLDAWAKSLEASEKVINSGEYALEADYRHLFRWDPISHPEDYMSKERILVLNHTTTGQTCYYPQVSLWANPVGTNATTVQMSVAGRVRCSVWVWYKWCGKYGGKLQKIGSYDCYATCPDPRLDATFAYGSVSSYDRETGIVKDIEVFPSESQIATSTGSTTTGHPFFRKYYSKSFNLDAGDADLYLMRYADVLLTAAEACAELSAGPGDANWDKAISYVNQVLKRARQSVNDVDFNDPTTWSEHPKDWNSADYADKKDLVSAIMWERIFEMGLEDHEWFDSHKRGAQWIVDNVTKPINDFLKASPVQWASWFEQFFYGRYLSEDVNQIRKGLLLSFPEYEIRYNTSLSEKDQNDFYIE